jgi:hypothetical protein
VTYGIELECVGWCGRNNIEDGGTTCSLSALSQTRQVRPLHAAIGPNCNITTQIGAGYSLNQSKIVWIGEDIDRTHTKSTAAGKAFLPNCSWVPGHPLIHAIERQIGDARSYQPEGNSWEQAPPWRPPPDADRLLERKGVRLFSREGVMVKF